MLTKNNSLIIRQKKKQKLNFTKLNETEITVIL